MHSLDRQEKGVSPMSQFYTPTLEGLRAEVESPLAASGHDSVYNRKAKLINRAIQDIGMGRYQWGLFFSPWIWLDRRQGVALTLTLLSLEFGVSKSQVRFITCALFVGLVIGATFRGLASGLIGRRPLFNITLFLCGVFGLAAGGGPTWISTCALHACLGLGVGGNMPVDAAIFLEFLPFALLAWAFILNFSCSEAASYTKADNMGRRHLVLSLGAIMFDMLICRFFFTLYESPKFLIGGYPEKIREQTLSLKQIVARSLSKFSVQQIGPLFATKRLRITTILIWFCWATIGMGYTLFDASLPQYLSTSASTYETYRNYAITGVIGLPGPVLARYTVGIKYVGRKGTMSISTLITGILLFCFTAANTSNTQLVRSTLESFFQVIIYGTATGIASCLNRIAGLYAPIVTIYAGDVNTSAPIYVSSALLLLHGVFKSLRTGDGEVKPFVG
ncbi:major facilitator superfamily domain-containing protein [Aspergillus alliaceus]|uniref:Major facilitator superfamily domain-containing protein n=1 Tax=Petromyces alliaceus TaxID=209559 RepID=A0A5N7C4R0_PETAA|nr:major facilitator superfamily domain-containing protein [Aspergillus alliaceus]